MVFVITYIAVISHNIFRLCLSSLQLSYLMMCERRNTMLILSYHFMVYRKLLTVFYSRTFYFQDNREDNPLANKISENT